MHSAADGRHCFVAQVLIESAAAVNTGTYNQLFTSLTLAAIDGDIEVIYILIDAGADKDQISRTFSTPLMQAAYYGDE